MGKYIFFDIDGTLIDFKGKIPESTINALNAVRKAGHKIFLCTGRSVCQMQKELKRVTFDGMVAASGAYVECDGKEVYHHYMPKEDVKAVIDEFHKEGTMFCCQTKEHSLREEDSRIKFIDLFKRRGMSEKNLESIFNGEDKDITIEDNIDKIEKIIYNESTHTVDELKSIFSKNIEVVRMSYDSMDIYSGEISTYGVNKALGIEKVLEYYGGSIEDTMAFGDGPNDFEMIEYVNTGIVMGNGIDELKKKADYVTKDILDHGIESALKHFELI